ncbi:MAG: ribosomal subunit interface protein [Gammaproteobacteria bacterium]|nr:MAG: ribosomal subunit interface protein [Gammaproteobacteria bacterium]
MNISISGHHVSITNGMRAAVMDKLSRVERRFDQIQSIKVILSLDNHHSETSHSGHQNHKAEAIMRVAGHEMFVSVSQDDMYQAINEMADKLDRQARKYKTKLDRKSRASKRLRLKSYRMDDYAAAV